MPDESPPVSPSQTETGPRAFVHDLCREPTEMPADQVRGRLENPHGYNDWVYCAKCAGYVARRECRWADTNENLGDFFDRAKAAVPPPPTSVGAALTLAVPIILGGAVGYVWSGGTGALWGALAGLVLGARDRCDETVAMFRTVRDARYRYIKNFMPERPFLQANDYKDRSYPVWNLLKQLDAQGKLTPEQKFLTAPHMPAEELYDLTADPHEIVNLAERPEHRSTLERLRGVLEKWMVETNDQGRTPEPPEVAKAKGLTKAGGNLKGQAIVPDKK